MKQIINTILAAAAICGTAAANDMKKAHDFLKDAGHYFIATCDQDQPRVRPFGTVHIYQGKLYIQTGKKKDVARQILRNPKVELCAFKNGRWIRLSGTLAEDPSLEAQKAMLDAYPSLKKIYRAGDGNNMVLYFKNASGSINSFTEPKVPLKF